MRKGREQENPQLRYEAQLIWRAAFSADPVCFPCPGYYHLLFAFDQQGKWRPFLKVNIKYNAIATTLLFHKVLYLEVREGSDPSERRE